MNVKSVLLAACISVMSLGAIGTAQAYTVRDTVKIHDVLVSSDLNIWHDTASWSHQLPSDFSLASHVDSAQLAIGFIGPFTLGNNSVTAGGSALGDITGSAFDITSLMENWGGSSSLDVSVVTDLLAFLKDSTFEMSYYNEPVSNGTNNGTAPVPEPATLLLMGTGLSGFALWARRKSGFAA